MTDAFNTLRRYARANNRRLADVAEDFINGTLPIASLTPQPPRP
jgi:hypothetical protein